MFNGDRILRAPVIDVDYGDTPLVITSEADSEGASATPKNISLSRSMSGDTIGSRPSSSGRDTSKPQPQTPTQVLSTTPSKSGSTGTGKSTKRDRKGRDKELEKALERERTRILGKTNRAKLLRAWVEISAWFVDWKRRNGEPFCSILHWTLDKAVFLTIRFSPISPSPSSPSPLSVLLTPLGARFTSLHFQSYTIMQNKAKALSTLPSSYNPHDLHIALNTGGKISASGSVSVREMYQSRLGAHVDQRE